MGVPLLEVEELAVEFRRDGRWVTVVDDVSFQVHEGQTVGIVGESGCGKTVTSLALLGLVPALGGRIAGGAVRFVGRDLLTASEGELRRVRGADIGLVFQQPMRSLNPAFTVGEQIAEVLRRHRGLSRRAAHDRAVELLDRVAIPSPERRVRDYPHTLSGGMAQRVMIAAAIACDPKLIVADEPTTALDVTVQARILDLLREIQEDTGVGIVFITHDLGVVAEACDEVAVMYAGQTIESGPVADVFGAPSHPYTAALLASVVRPGRRHQVGISGAVPRPGEMPTGCRFSPRCSSCLPELCMTSPPDPSLLAGGLMVRCARHEDLSLMGVEPP